MLQWCKYFKQCLNTVNISKHCCNTVNISNNVLIFNTVKISKQCCNTVNISNNKQCLFQNNVSSTVNISNIIIANV